MTRLLPVLLIWLFAFTGSAAAHDAAAIDKGKQVYAAQKCQVCHSVAGVGNKKGALDDVGARLKEAEIRQWIVAAPEMTARGKAERKPPMKSYSHLPKDELDALVAYLASLKK